MSFPRYPKYKDSGVEWLGEVPEHWALPRIKTISRISGGGTPSREVPEYWNGDIPWVSPKDMKAERISTAEESITDLGLSQSTSSLHQPDRVLMVIRSGILQRVIPVAINEAMVAINQDMKVFTFDSEACLPRFFLRWVQGLNDRLLLEWAHQGATVESINQSLMLNTVIPLPPLSEQTAIAAFLDHETAKIDSLIAEQHRLIELLQEKRQAVISHAVTKGLDPDVPMKNSGIAWLGKVPEHWQVVRLRYLCNIQTGSRDTENAVEEGKYPFFVRSETIERIDTCAADCEAVLTAGDGVGVGKVFHHYEGPFDFHQRVYMMNAFRRVTGRFLYHYLRTNFYKVALEGTAKSTVDSLRRPMFTGFPVAVPPVPEQHSIVEIIEARAAQFDGLVAQSTHAITLLQERRSALISAAVTGQIDIRGLAGTEAA
jgi:type I restriction enzyme S subunit